MDHFIHHIRQSSYYQQVDYRLQWIQFETRNFKQQLTSFSSKCCLHYVIMGSRKQDPHCQSLGLISPSTQGYPKFQRINPIIDWNYNQVWKFIKDFQLPYCKLYDQGYSHIGNKKNTTKNPSLLDPSSLHYKPAYQGSEQTENLSRLTQNSKKQ